MKDALFFILICVGVFFLIKWYRKFKVVKTNSLVMITGGVKSGKSTFSVYLAISEHKRQVRKVKFQNFFRKLLHKELLEIPLLYSNVPLAVPYVKITKDLLLMNSRFVNRSVAYIQEASLFSDSQLIYDKTLNVKLLMFYKLFGHITKGGKCFVDTQCIQDVHYSLKRSLSNYFYIHHIEKRIPFFVIAYVRELMYSDDGSIVNSVNEDLEESLKKVLIRKSVWNKFNCYCMYSLVEDKPVENRIVKLSTTNDLCCTELVSFRPEYNIKIYRVKKGGSNEVKTKFIK